MDLIAYKYIHLVGILTFFFAMGGMIMGAWLSNARKFPHKSIFSILHGLGLMLILISGFGQLAKINSTGNGFPGWIVAKIVIWLILGALMSPILRRPDKNQIFWVLTLLLGFGAAYLALFKPF